MGLVSQRLQIQTDRPALSHQKPHNVRVAGPGYPRVAWLSVGQCRKVEQVTDASFPPQVRTYSKSLLLHIRSGATPPHPVVRRREILRQTTPQNDAGVWADATSRGLAWFAESKKAQFEYNLPVKSLLPAVGEGQDEGEVRRDRL